MRLGMVTQWYDPEVGSAGLAGVIARALHGRGHQVDVVTGVPNYPEGRVYPGYRMRPYQREVREGVTVHRAPLYPSHDARAVHRAGNFLSFAASASAVALRVLREVDATLVYSSPATTCIPAMAASAVHRTPYVLLIQDMWPQSVVSSHFLGDGGNRRVEPLLHSYCDTTYRRAASIAVTSPGMADLIASRGVDPAKIQVVPNWADEQVFRPQERTTDALPELADWNRFTVMYAGNLGEVQGLEVVVKAAERLREHRDIGFVLVGGGVCEAALRRQVDELALDNVRFVPAQPMQRMGQVLAAADVQLVSLRDLPLFESTLPSKVQATLASGRPVIGAVAGDAARVIDESGAGWVVPPGSASALATAALEASRTPRAALQQKGLAGREHYLDHLSEQAGAGRLLQMLSDAAETSARAARRR